MPLKILCYDQNNLVFSVSGMILILEADLDIDLLGFVENTLCILLTESFCVYILILMYSVFCRRHTGYSAIRIMLYTDLDIDLFYVLCGTHRVLCCNSYAAFN